MRIPKALGALAMGALLLCVPLDAAQARNSTWVDSGETIVYHRMPIHPLFRFNAPRIQPQQVYQSSDEDQDFDDSWDSLRVFPLSRSLNTPLKVYVDQRSNLYRNQYDGFVKDSLAQWSKALDGRLRYEFVDSRDNAQITVSWVNGFGDGDTAGLTNTRIGHADVRIKTPGIPENIIHGDIMHELGHALGIEGHSHKNDDIMMSGRNWSSASEFHNYHPMLSQRDIQAIRRLYDTSWQKGEDLYTATAQQATVARVAMTPQNYTRRVSSRILLPDPQQEPTISRQASIQYRQPVPLPVNDTRAYMGDIQNQVKRYWRSPGLPQGSGAIVLFRINRNGGLVGYRLMRSSGQGAIDLSAVQALQRSAPFTALPQSYGNNTLDVKLTFN